MEEGNNITPKASIWRGNWRDMEGNSSTATTPKGSLSFRDSDVEFLQTQAKEWLEAMLGEKLLEPQQEEGRRSSLAEILANGEILYKVSQMLKELIVIRNNKLGGSNDDNLDHPLPPYSPDKMRAVSSSPGKNSQKYLPYSYVEAFLKVSKDMVGLQDVDLFNPSDAIDMKDIRRVCVCLRRLSKKARAQQLPVPDFDNVAQTTTATATTAAAMPTEFVHGRKESLQKSASKSSTTSEPNKEKTSSQREHSQPSQEENTHPSEAGKKKRDHHEEEASAAKRRGEKAADAEKRKNRRVRWFPVVTGVVVFVSTFVALTIRAAPKRRRRRSKAHAATAEADDYEVQKGDTLSIISRRTGHNWHELVQNNPHIANPDLIFPSEHLKL